MRHTPIIGGNTRLNLRTVCIEVRLYSAGSRQTYFGGVRRSAWNIGDFQGRKRILMVTCPQRMLEPSMIA